MLLWYAGQVSGKSAGDARGWETGKGVPDAGGSDGNEISEGGRVMDMDNKIYVSEFEHDRLCRIDGKVDAIIGYINEKERENGFVDASVIKAIIGMDNFAREREETDV